MDQIGLSGKETLEGCCEHANEPWNFLSGCTAGGLPRRAHHHGVGYKYMLDTPVLMQIQALNSFSQQSFLGAALSKFKLCCVSEVRPPSFSNYERRKHPNHLVSSGRANLETKGECS
jgi:hypothetical protein